MRATAIYIPGSSINGSSRVNLKILPNDAKVGEDESDSSPPRKIPRLSDTPNGQMILQDDINKKLLTGSVRRRLPFGIINDDFKSSLSATKLILQGVMKIFKKHSPEPELPKPQLPLSTTKHSLRTQPTAAGSFTDTEDEKENIPPTELPAAVKVLQEFREEAALVRQRKGEVPPPPPGGRRLAPTRLSQQNSRTNQKEVLKDNTEKEKETPIDDKPNKSTKPIRRRSSCLIDTTHNTNHHDTIVTRSHLDWFFQLVEEPVIHQFLKNDICRRYADKYLLAMVFTYFIRTGFLAHQYTRENFFAALYLAHDMEEDEEELKYEVFPWVLGPHWRHSYPRLIAIRDSIFWGIDCRGIVSRRCCEQVMEMQPKHWLWERERPNYHGWAVREHLRYPSDNGQPRGPNKSPLQCQMCLERECAASQSSYLLYLSESEDSPDTVCLAEEGQTTEHKERLPAFETILCRNPETNVIFPVNQDSTTEGNWTKEDKPHTPLLQSFKLTDDRVIMRMSVQCQGSVEEKNSQTTAIVNGQEKDQHHHRLLCSQANTTNYTLSPVY
ncbi:hypothetical protein Pmani_016724 [Petrolisthes manimaculis]|uniref:Speedy protein A n=1 Tax=Petrolisthes manimaculis TaxID=1843537 RepID=A0AAE1PPS2_9EUCA|nr:hypothetical protein Pmani_016724 [Petrolisthes manimaculis]